MPKQSQLKPWLMWLLAVLFYFYQFIIRVATGNLREPLTLEFNLTAAEFSMVGAYWLVSYALLQIPVGVALDKWGAKKVFTGSALLCAAGTFLMASTESFGLLCLARFLIGAGSASAFVGTFKISSEWFAPNRLPVLVGCISGIGVLGASLAGAPMVKVLSLVGWRSVFYTLSGLAFVLAGAYALFLQDKHLNKSIHLKDIQRQVKQLLLEPQIWLLGAVGFLLYTPVSVLADLWGPSFLNSAYGYSNIDAAFTTSFIFYGNAVGSFAAGWMFLKFRTNKNFLLCFNLLAVIVMAAIVWMAIPNFLILSIILFILGIIVGSENMIFPLGARYAAPGYQGLSASVINFLVMVGATVLQPAVGVVLDYLWTGAMVDGRAVYSATEYRWGLSILIGALVVGAVISLRVKGTTKTANH